MSEIRTLKSLESNLQFSKYGDESQESDEQEYQTKKLFIKNSKYLNMFHTGTVFRQLGSIQIIGYENCV